MSSAQKTEANLYDYYPKIRPSIYAYIFSICEVYTPCLMIFWVFKGKEVSFKYKTSYTFPSTKIYR